MELYCFGNCIGRMERLYLGRDTRRVREGLFILENTRDHRENKMVDAGKSRGWDAEEGEERKQKRPQLWKEGVKRRWDEFERESWRNTLQPFPLGVTVSDVGFL